ELARTAIEELDCEILVLDDGFQHRRLARDLDIILIDVTDPWAGGYLLPRGGLREPRKNLRRAGMVVLTRCDATLPGVADSVAAHVRRIATDMPIARTIHAALELLGGQGSERVAALRGRPVGAFCGLGNPEAFRQTLTTLGADVHAFRTFADHHAYSRADVEDLGRSAAELPADAWVITTQKDWVKLRLTELAGHPIWALRVGLQFVEGQELFDNAIRGVAAAQRQEGSWNHST